MRRFITTCPYSLYYPQHPLKNFRKHEKNPHLVSRDDEGGVVGGEAEAAACIIMSLDESVVDSFPLNVVISSSTCSVRKSLSSPSLLKSMTANIIFVITLVSFNLRKYVRISSLAL